MKYFTIIGAAAMVVGITGAAHAEYDLGCKVDDIKTLVTWCIDPAQRAFPNYSKMVATIS